MELIEEKGDLFDIDLDKYALAHCISLDCAMGAGIAKEFVKRYPRMKKELLKDIELENLTYPMTLYYLTEKDVIFNMVTKERYWHKPTYETIAACIKDLAYYCTVYGIDYLAMPRIGCGLDRLNWSKVRKIILEEFKDIDIEILVKYL